MSLLNSKKYKKLPITTAEISYNLILSLLNKKMHTQHNEHDIIQKNKSAKPTMRLLCLQTILEARKKSKITEQTMPYKKDAVNEKSC